MITPILLCGGSGTRLWPLSRRSYPKQFTQLTGEETLFQGSARRLSGADFAAPVVLTNADFRFIVTEQLGQIGIDPGAIMIEPEGRNTAPAILAAALWLEKTAPGNLMLVAPSDHVVPDIAAFQEAVRAGVDAAEQGQLVTFGIKPTHPETAYGWLELREGADTSRPRAVDLVRFVEKPDEVTAKKMLASGNFLWNGGLFLFSVKAVIDAFTKHAPELVAPTRRAVESATKDLNFTRLAPDAWSEIPDISIDYAIMEKSHNLSVVPFSAGWSDLGSWDSVWREMEPDAAGVATSGPSTAIDCHNTMLRAEEGGQHVVGIGLDNLVVVAMPDAVLVADKSRAQEVKTAVNTLKSAGVAQAVQLPRDYRPWGWFETLALGPRFQVKRIVVHPGAALSLQSHMHRSEHWIVVAGTAKVTVDDTVKLVSENQSIYVPLGAVHRMENPGKVPMVLVEVQTGAYVGEDDIIRYEDVYARS